MKSITLFTLSFFHFVFASSVLAKLNNDPRKQTAGVAESQIVNKDDLGNDDTNIRYDESFGDGGGGGGGGGDDDGYGKDDDEDEDYPDFEVKIRINGDEELTFHSIGAAGTMEYTEPEPKYVRQAEITKAPRGLYCVFWAPASEGNSESFISPVMHVPKKPDGRIPTDMEKAALTEFKLHPEVPSIPAHGLLHFHLHREYQRIIILIETWDGDFEDAVLLMVDLDQHREGEGRLEGQRAGGITLNGDEGRFSIFGYRPFPNIRRARVLVAPFLERTFCAVGKLENIAHFAFTSQGQKPEGSLEGAQRLVCVENPE